MQRYRRLLAVVVLLALLWAVFRVTGLESRLSVQMLHDAFERNRLAGMLVFTLLFALGNLVQVPGWLFLASAVIALGEFWGGIATYAAASVSCVATFLAIRLVGADALREFQGPVAKRIFARLDAHPAQSVVLLRLLFQTVPALNYTLALSGVRFRDYMVGTLLGLPLPILLYSVFFESLADWLHWSIPVRPG